MRSRLNQRFEVYTGATPELVVQAIKADLDKFTDTGWAIKQMNVLLLSQTPVKVAAWALWEQQEGL